jgi:hypothetical protein
MSRAAIAAALARDDLSCGERLVGFSLASFADRENRGAADAGKAQGFSIVCGRRDHFLLRSRGTVRSRGWNRTLVGRDETEANHRQRSVEASAIRRIKTG